MMRALAAPAGRGFSGPRNVRDPFSPRLGRTREGIRGGVIAGGHRMAVPADGRCLRGGRPWCGVPAAGVSCVRWADGVVVGLLAVCPRGGAVPEDVRAAGALRVLPGQSCPAAGVRAGLAAGYGRDRRRGDRAGGRRFVRGAAGRGAGRCPGHDWSTPASVEAQLCG